MPSSLFRPVALLAATLALGACTAYDRGYSRVSVGYGYGGYASPHYGWYDGFYYPGTGYYIYDRYGSRYRWSDRQRRYWHARRSGHRNIRDNWSGYRREARRDRREGNREWRRDRRENSREWRRDRRENSRDRRRDRADNNRSWSRARSEAARSRGDSRSEARRDRRNNSNERRGWRTRPRD